MSSLVSKSSFDCMKKAGIEFGVMRCFTELGSVDPNCKDTVKNGHAAGLEMDAYFFPAPQHISANSSVEMFYKGFLITLHFLCLMLKTPQQTKLSKIFH